MSNRDCFIAFSNYYATGEGATSLLALGSSREQVEKVFIAKADPYFHPGRSVLVLNDETSEEAQRMPRFVPAAVIDLIRENPPETTEWFSHLHYNLA